MILLDFLYLTELKFRIFLAIQEVKRPGGRGGAGGVHDISLGGEVRRGPSYPYPVQYKYR